MLPWIIGAVVVAAVSSTLSKREEQEKLHNKRNLENQYDLYSANFQEKSTHNYRKKQKILFYQIKNEQSKLKKERQYLYGLLNNVKKGNKEYRIIKNQISELSFLIEKKQSDANRVKY